jgi:uncharacterized membrane protein YfcA
MSVEVALAAALIVAFAAFGQTVTGFGFSLLAVPSLGLVIDPKEAVAVATMLLVVNSALLAWGERHYIDRRAVRLLLLGALPGLPVGLVLLAAMPVVALRFALASAILAAVAILASGVQLSSSRASVELSAGFAAGVLTTSLSANGPPTALVLQARGLAPHAFRPTTSAVLGLTSAVGVALFGFAGRLTDEVLGVTVVAIPAMILGWSIGLRVRRYVAPVAFRRLILGLLVLAALATMVAALS